MIMNYYNCKIKITCIAKISKVKTVMPITTLGNYKQNKCTSFS